MNIQKILLDNSATPSRREFLKTSGMLIVGVSAAAVAGPFVAEAAAQTARGLYPDPDYHQLDSWIVVHEDNTATFYVGKTDCGQGTGTAFRQMMSDELDIAFKDTACIMGTTDITVDQGGSGGSDAIQTDGWPMRRVAAEARRVLLDMGSQRLGTPVSGLAVSNAVITVKNDPSKRVTYGELIGGKKFNVTLTGANIDATTGVAKGEARTGTEDGWPVATAVRHPGKGGWIAEVGGGRKSAGDGARPQHQAARRRCEVDRHRRIVRAQYAGLRESRQQG
jgi:CO/xanthine dehydrogenase Mo-binding subunit